MFICDYCSKAIGPRVPLNLRQVAGEERHVTYQVVRRDPETHGETRSTAFGTEITREFKVCPECLGLKSKTTQPQYGTSPLGYIALVRSLQEHAKRCKKLYVECSACLLAELTYFTVPIDLLTTALETTKAKQGHFTLGAIAVDNLLKRGEHASKRGQADFAAAYAVLKGYEQRGGGI